MTNRERMEVYRDVAGGWRFRVKAANHEITATSESYTRKDDAIRAAAKLKPELPIWAEGDEVRPAPDQAGEG